MGVPDETFNQLDALEVENRLLKKALTAAAKFAATSCERCPYDSRFGCNRPDKNIECTKAVAQYFYQTKD